MSEELISTFNFVQEKNIEPRFMDSNSDTIDCVIVGYNQVSFEKVMGQLEKTKKYSGAFSRKYKAGSVYFRKKRINYMNLMNTVIKDVTGEDHELHILELPNLGVTYLTSYCRARGANVEFINHFNKGKERLKSYIESGAKSVAITTTFYGEMTPIKEIVEYIRSISETVKIIVGGAHIFNVCNQNPEASQDYIFADTGCDIYVNDSQGENALFRILIELRKGAAADLSCINNLIYKSDDGKFLRTPRIAEDNDLNENIVRWDLFDKEFFTPTAIMRTARSCAYKCSFCNYPYFAGKLTLTDVSVVEKEMRQMKEAGVEYLQFTDDTFNVPLPRFKDLMRMMIKNKFNFKWFSYFRCASSDKEAFDLLAESGCAGVFLGIESGAESVLDNMNKKVTLEKYRNGMKELHDRGIVTFVSLICGFPGETAATIQETIDFVNETKPTYYDLELYYHSLTAPIHKEADKYGIKGAGYGWKHNTMDWKEAIPHLERMYRDITGSIIMPEQSFSMYAIPYLLSKGINMEQIHGFCTIVHSMMIKSLSDDYVDTTHEEEALLRFFKKALQKDYKPTSRHNELKSMQYELAAELC